jgi:hypothetical protein
MGLSFQFAMHRPRSKDPEQRGQEQLEITYGFSKITLVAAPLQM